MDIVLFMQALRTIKDKPADSAGAAGSLTD